MGGVWTARRSSAAQTITIDTRTHAYETDLGIYPRLDDRGRAPLLHERAAAAAAAAEGRDERLGQPDEEEARGGRQQRRSSSHRSSRAFASGPVCLLDRGFGVGVKDGGSGWVELSVSVDVCTLLCICSPPPRRLRWDFEIKVDPKPPRWSEASCVALVVYWIRKGANSIDLDADAELAAWLASRRLLSPPRSPRRR